MAVQNISAGQVIWILMNRIDKQFQDAILY